MELFANIVNGFQVLPILPKKICHRCLTEVIDIRLSYRISKSNKPWIGIITDDIAVQISMCEIFKCKLQNMFDDYIYLGSVN